MTRLINGVIHFSKTTSFQFSHYHFLFFAKFGKIPHTFLKGRALPLCVQDHSFVHHFAKCHNKKHKLKQIFSKHRPSSSNKSLLLVNIKSSHYYLIFNQRFQFSFIYITYTIIETIITTHISS